MWQDCSAPPTYRSRNRSPAHPWPTMKAQKCLRLLHQPFSLARCWIKSVSIGLDRKTMMLNGPFGPRLPAKSRKRPNGSAILGAVHITPSRRSCRRARSNCQVIFIRGHTTELCDLSKLQPPSSAAAADVCFLLGVLEYLPDVEGAIRSISDLCDWIVFSYCSTDLTTERWHLWINAYSGPEIGSLVGLAGFRIEKCISSKPGQYVMSARARSYVRRKAHDGSATVVSPAKYNLARYGDGKFTSRT